MARIIRLFCIGLIAGIFSPSVVSASSVVLTPLNAQGSGVSIWSVVPDATSLRAAQRSIIGASTQYMGILEYPLSGIPDDSIVTGAALKLNVTANQPNSQLSLITYAGDGFIQSSDVVAWYPVNATQTISYLGEYSIPLNVSPIQGLIAGSASHLGVVIRQTLIGDTTFQGYPELTIHYTPEPACASLVAIGSLVLLRRRVCRVR